MADENAIKNWHANFRFNIRVRNRERAFWIMENMRMLCQSPMNRLTDEQVDLWFEMLELFNEAFPESPACFASEPD